MSFAVTKCRSYASAIGSVAKPTVFPPPLRNSLPEPHSEEALAMKRKPDEDYFVRRTDNGWLPVYSEFRSGRSRIMTIIRRVDGQLEVRIA